MKVLFGLSQYCRYFLQFPTIYPPIAEDFSAATTLLDLLEEHIKQNQQTNYEDIPLADTKTTRQLLYDDYGDKIRVRRDRRVNRILSLPHWMQDSMELEKIPRNFSARQRRAIFAEEDALENEESWVKEGEEKNVPQGELVEEIDDVRSIPLVRRFKEIEQPEENRPLERYSSVYGQYVKGVYAKKDGVEINLDEVPDAPSTPSTSSGQMGGYTIVDMLNPQNFENIPKEALDIIQVAPQALKGVHYYKIDMKTGGADTPFTPLFDKKMVQDMWASSSNFNPPFIKKVPFDAPNRRSGGTLPPSALHALAETIAERNRTAEMSSNTPSSSSFTAVCREGTREFRESRPRAGDGGEEGMEKEEPPTPLLHSIVDAAIAARQNLHNEYASHGTTTSPSASSTDRGIRNMTPYTPDTNPPADQEPFVDPFGKLSKTLTPKPDKNKNKRDEFGELPVRTDRGNRESRDQDDITDITELPQRINPMDDPFSTMREEDTPEVTTSHRSKKQEFSSPARTPRGDFHSLRRGLDEPTKEKKPPAPTFSRKASGSKGKKGGLYFPGENLPPTEAEIRRQNADNEENTNSTGSSVFPQVPKPRSRLRQAKLGSTRGLIREKEDEDDKSPVALQKMINKKLRERVERGAK